MHFALVATAPGEDGYLFYLAIAIVVSGLCFSMFVESVRNLWRSRRSGARRIVVAVFATIWGLGVAGFGVGLSVGAGFGSERLFGEAAVKGGLFVDELLSPSEVAFGICVVVGLLGIPVYVLLQRFEPKVDAAAVRSSR